MQRHYIGVGIPTDSYRPGRWNLIHDKPCLSTVTRIAELFIHVREGHETTEGGRGYDGIHPGASEIGLDVFFWIRGEERRREMDPSNGITWLGSLHVLYAISLPID